jgi:hypothetical protein
MPKDAAEIRALLSQDLPPEELVQELAARGYHMRLPQDTESGDLEIWRTDASGFQSRVNIGVELNPVAGTLLELLRRFAPSPSREDHTLDPANIVERAGDPLPPEARRNCPNCDAVIARDASRCPWCDAPL